LAYFIAAKSYRDVVAGIRRGNRFPAPERRLINKFGSDKKRVVYSFPEAHTNVLKLLAHLLYRYDSKQPPGCYSFRQGTGAHQAIRRLVRTPGIGTLWCYKTDVHDYFNSIDVQLLLPILAEVIDDDPELYSFLAGLLSGDDFETEPGGVMPGVPVAPFFANLYLGELDRHFVSAGQPYARYSDDIIVFAASQEQVLESKAWIHTWLAEHGLAVNPDKEYVTAPGEPWEFLGISYCQGQLDLSQATRNKLKGKIRRKARKLRRWMLRNDAEPERAIRAVIRTYNRKFFDVSGTDELNWSRWFFPLLTRADSLHEMDEYLQQYLRWIPTGKHRAANYRTSYESLNALGYRTLVNDDHRYREEQRQN
jgi:hypothetical protein